MKIILFFIKKKSNTRVQQSPLATSIKLKNLEFVGTSYPQATLPLRKFISLFGNGNELAANSMPFPTKPQNDSSC